MAIKTKAELKAAYGYGQNPHDFDDFIDTMFSLALVESTITGVSVAPSTIDLSSGGDTGILIATVTGTGMYSTAVTWTTSDAGIATVAEGIVTPLSEGSVTITATSIQDIDFSDTCAVTVGPVAINTKPRLGVAGPIPTLTAAQVWAALSTISSASAGSRVAGSSGSPLIVTPGENEYGWFACLASGAPTGITVNTTLGSEEWAGADNAGQFVGNDPEQIPTTIHASYTDGDGNVWHMIRQNYKNASESIWFS